MSYEVDRYTQDCLRDPSADLVSRMVALARLDRKAAKGMRFLSDETRGEAIGLMKAARMVKGYETQARFIWSARRAA